MHSIRKSYSMKWQIRKEVGMECHRPDEKLQRGRMQCFLPPPLPPLSSSSSSLKCSHLRTEGVNKVMGEPITPESTFYGSVTFRPIEMIGRGQVAWGLGRGVPLNRKMGMTLESGCLSSKPSSMPVTLRVLLKPLRLFPLLPVRIVIVFTLQRGSED